MICPKCQKNIPADSEICMGCGAQLSGPSRGSFPEDSPTEKRTQEKNFKPASAVEAKITKVAKAALKPKDAHMSINPEAALTRVAKTEVEVKTKVFIRKEKPIHGWLVVIKGMKQWEQFTLCEENRRFVIGSAADADIRFQDEGVEPRHASLRLEGDRLIMTDLDTASGTLVQGEKIVRKEIEDGNQIQIGTMFLKYRKL